MSCDRNEPEETILWAITRRMIPMLIGILIFVTGVAVVFGWLALVRYIASDQIGTAFRDYLWVVVWTGGSEGVALLVGFIAYYRISRRLIRPLGDLSEAAVAATRSGQPATFGTHGPIREINRLSHSFNELFAVRERQSRELKNLTRNVLHDLRTPLTHIRHNAELVHDGKTDVLPAMEKIAESCNAILDLVDTNSEISSNYSGSDLTPPERQDIVAVVANLSEMYSAVADAKGIAFTCSLPQAPVPFLGHKYKLQRMIVNLLDNAFKFTPEGGHVALTVDRTAEGIVLRVSDTGIGISDCDKPHVFDRFFRASAARNESGNGLGLSLVHAIVTFYRGTIDCSSAPGKGSVFTILLPYDKIVLHSDP